MTFDEFFEEAERIGVTGDDLRKALGEIKSSRSPDCYAKFRRGDSVCVYMKGVETLGKFVGIDADGIITYQTGDPVEYLTAWDCNVYSA